MIFGYDGITVWVVAGVASIFSNTCSYQSAVMLTQIGDSQGVKRLKLGRSGVEGAIMGSAIGLREDFAGASMRRLARMTKSANQGRRLLPLVEIYDGGSRGDAARWACRSCALGGAVQCPWPRWSA